MKRLNLTISLLFFYLLSFAQLDGKMRPGDRLDYNPGPQPEWEPILIALAAAFGCLLLCALAYWLISKNENKFCKFIGIIISLAGAVGFIFFIGPCLITWRFWVLFFAILALFLIIIKCVEIVKEKKAKEAYILRQKKLEKRMVNWGDYTYYGVFKAYVTSYGTPKVDDEGQSLEPSFLFCNVYCKDGTYFIKSPYDGSCIELEENPCFQDENFGTHKYNLLGETITNDKKDLCIYLHISDISEKLTQEIFSIN